MAARPPDRAQRPHRCRVERTAEQASRVTVVVLLDKRRMRRAAALAVVAVEWEPSTPKLVMVASVDNAGIRRRWP